MLAAVFLGSGMFFLKLFFQNRLREPQEGLERLPMMLSVIYRSIQGLNRSVRRDYPCILYLPRMSYLAFEYSL